MTQATLRTLTLKTVANYRQVAGHAVAAYRASGQRLLAMMGRNVDRAATHGAERVAPRLAAAVRRTSDKVTGFASRRIDAASARTQRIIELGSDGVAAQVSRVADLVDGIENRYVVTGLQTAARLSLAGAQAALSLSENLVVGADKLASAAGGRPTEHAQAAVKRAQRALAPRGRAAAKAMRRGAAVAPAAVTKQAKSVVKRLKAVAAPVKAPKPAAKRAAKARRAAAVSAAEAA